MSDTLESRPVPQVETKGGVIAYLAVDGAAKAAELYRKAFGAEIAAQHPADEQGRTMHIHLYINGSSLMLSDFYPEHGHAAKPVQACTMQLHLDEGAIDQWWQRAVDAGCEITTPLQVMFWGDRWGALRDPFGVDWAMNAPTRKS